MRVLFVGLGSVGQRHLMNFKQLMGSRADIIACRKTGRDLFIKNGIAQKVVSLKKYLGFKERNDLKEALKEKPDIVFISNPSSKHMETALKAAECGSHIFIEKPLGSNLKGISALRQLTKNKRLTVMIGYQTRFHPCYKLLKNALEKKKYGDVISASFEWGTYLPRHHPYEDYRKGYAAKKSLGGGVVLSLIHEVDLIYSFWGYPEKLFAIGGKLSDLEVNTEDTVSVLMGYKRRNKIFPVSLFLSYAQTKETRKCRIQLKKGTIFCDLIENSIKIFDKDGKRLVERYFPQLKRNDLFLAEMKEFLSAVKEKRQPAITLEDGIASLRLALKIKDKIKGSLKERA